MSLYYVEAREREREGERKEREILHHCGLKPHIDRM